MESLSTESVVVSNALSVDEVQSSFVTDYLHMIFCKKTFNKTLMHLRRKITLLKKEIDFDTIAFTGVSGAAVAFPICSTMGIPLICVRKKEASHSNLLVEGNAECKKYIIIDDRICSGNTIEAIMFHLRGFVPDAVCAGILLYCRPVNSPNSLTARNAYYPDFSFEKIPIFYTTDVTDK